MKVGHLSAILKSAIGLRLRDLLGLRSYPFKLELLVTGACNSRCRTCSIWKKSASASEMSISHASRLIRSARPQLRWVSITGGEPTLRNDLVELVDEIVRVGGTDLKVIQFTTNGLRPDRIKDMFPEIFRITRHLSVFVSVSLDGLEDSYEEVRGIPGGFALVRQSMTELRNAAASHPDVSLSHQVTVSRYNLDGLPALVDYVFADGDSPTFTWATDGFLLSGRDSLVDLRTDPGRIDDAVRIIGRHYGFGRLLDIPPGLFLRLSKPYFKTGLSVLPCWAGRAAVTVDADGVVYACDTAEYRIGDLADSDHDLKSLMNSEGAVAALGAARRCRGCWTPCHAYTSMMSSPLTAIIQLALRRHRKECKTHRLW